ncbi:hypothetical protein CSA56_16405 [candidate division KSB3 bacterium]|uniref:Uncharacterized protein n=1 Tax=candidate division KSB3 bacterium TaxID=2044937 RepID=A0A2G6KBK1_9BACT|nr:MAG: hypothetical protein CSA56_16405 [candidate division KSB3 bacterium]
MGILFDEQQQVFHLQGGNISSTFNILKTKQLGHVCFGRQIRHSDHEAANLGYTPLNYEICVFEGEREFSLDYLPQESPDSLHTIATHSTPTPVR